MKRYDDKFGEAEFSRVVSAAKMLANEDILLHYLTSYLVNEAIVEALYGDEDTSIEILRAKIKFIEDLRVQILSIANSEGIENYEGGL